MGYKEQLQELLTKYTQQEIAGLLGVTLRSVQNYVSDESSTKPYPKTLRKLDAIYKALIVEGRSIEEFAGQGNAGATEREPDYRLNKKNSQQSVMVPFLPVKAQAGYVKAHDQAVFVDALEKYAMPPGINPHGAVWRYWEVEGDSMEPAFHSGDIILTSQVPQLDWENLRNFYLYVIVTEDRAMLKRIFCKNLLEWVLISENEEQYPQQLLPAEVVKEVWVYRRSFITNAKPTRHFEIKI